MERAFKAVHARRAAFPEEEDWLIVLTTDHGGTARDSMSTAMQGAFACCDASGQAYGQADCEGVHGLSSLPQHMGTFLVVDHGRVESGSTEILPPPRNKDLAATVLAHFGVNPQGAWCERNLEAGALDGRALLAQTVEWRVK